jgi:hypothetical protein
MLDYKTKADDAVEEKAYHKIKFGEVVNRLPKYAAEALGLAAKNGDDRLLLMIDELKIVLHELKWVGESDIERILQESGKNQHGGDD